MDTQCWRTAWFSGTMIVDLDREEKANVDDWGEEKADIESKVDGDGHEGKQRRDGLGCDVSVWLCWVVKMQLDPLWQRRVEGRSMFGLVMMRDGVSVS